MREFDNVGIVDTAIRSIVAIVLLALAAEGLFTPAVSWVLLVLGSALFISAATGVCLFYRMLGIDTYHQPNH